MEKKMESKPPLYDNNLPEKTYYFPPELFTGILASLSAKSLLKFRCVCKSWRALIDSSDFLYLHRKHHNIPSYIPLSFEISLEDADYRVLYIPHDETHEFSIDSNTSLCKSYTLLGTCNGLMIMTKNLKPCHGNSKQDTLVMLWNPCIRKALVLPVCPIDGCRGPPCCYILGFAPSSNDYKVLALKKIDEKGRDHEHYTKKMVPLAVYSLNDHVWRVRKVNVKDWDLFGLASGSEFVIVGGVLYWFGSEPGKLGSSSDTQRTHLIFFDFDDEKFSSVKLPFVMEECTEKFIFLLGQSVAVFVLSTEGSCVWVLDKNSREEPWRVWFSGDRPHAYYTHKYGRTFGYSNCFKIRKSYKAFEVYYKLSSNSHNALMFHDTNYGDICLDTFVDTLVLHKGFEERQIMSPFPC